MVIHLFIDSLRNNKEALLKEKGFKRLRIRTSPTAAWPGTTPCWCRCASESGTAWHRSSGKHRSPGAPSGSMEAAGPQLNGAAGIIATIVGLWDGTTVKWGYDMV